MRKALLPLVALLTALVLVALPEQVRDGEGGPRADTVALRETFDGRAFPPAGWTLVNHNASPSGGWRVERSDFPTPAAEHEDEHGFRAEDSLQTPVIDLRGYQQAYLHFQSLTWFAEYQAGHLSGAGDGRSTIEISVDGGRSFTRGFWVSEQLRSGVIENVTLDLSAFAGQAEVVLRFGYGGTYAHNWVIDSVTVDAWPLDPPPPPAPPAPWARGPEFARCFIIQEVA